MNKGDGNALRAQIKQALVAEFEREQVAPVMLASAEVVHHLLTVEPRALDEASPVGARVQLTIEAFEHYLARHEPNESPFWVRKVRDVVVSYHQLRRSVARERAERRLDASVFDLP